MGAATPSLVLSHPRSICVSHWGLAAQLAVSAWEPSADAPLEGLIEPAGFPAPALRLWPSCLTCSSVSVCLPGLPGGPMTTGGLCCSASRHGPTCLTKASFLLHKPEAERCRQLPARSCVQAFGWDTLWSGCPVPLPAAPPRSGLGLGLWGGGSGGVPGLLLGAWGYLAASVA